MTLNEAAKTINNRCAEMWKNPEVRKSVIKHIMAENPPITEEKNKRLYVLGGSLHSLLYRGRTGTNGERTKTNNMKRITQHLAAFAVFAPCLLTFTAGSLFVNAAGVAYMAGLVYASGHTARGKRFARTYYKEVLRLEKLLQTNNF